MSNFLTRFRERQSAHFGIIAVYAASLLLMLHFASVAYINSSYLEQFLPTEAVGTIYTISSALTVLVFLFISRVLRRVGNYQLTMGLLLINFAAMSGMAFADTLRVAVPLFLLHVMIVPLIIFNLDVFLEALIDNNESTTGSKRGLLLTLLSVISATAPLVTTATIGTDTTTFTPAYIISAFTLLPIILILIIFFKRFSDSPYHEINVFGALRSFWRNRNIRNVLGAQFTLQLFFVAMVIYAPLYLTQTIGLSWSELGVVIFFGQVAYILFEYPIGILADKYIGEREMMGLGFLVLAVSTAWIAFLTIPSVWLWALVMFVTRVGASLVEVTTESYFFKQTKSSDAQIISFFRITRPLAYIVGTLTASLALLYLPFNLLFIVFASLMIPAMFMTLNIEDTR